MLLPHPNIKLSEVIAGEAGGAVLTSVMRPAHQSKLLRCLTGLHGARDFNMGMDFGKSAWNDADAIFTALASLGGESNAILRRLNGRASPLLNDRAFVLSLVALDGSNLEYAHAEFRQDREVVLAAVKNCRGSCEALQLASEELKSDAEIVSHALHQTRGLALKYLGTLRTIH